MAKAMAVEKAMGAMMAAAMANGAVEEVGVVWEALAVWEDGAESEVGAIPDTVWVDGVLAVPGGMEEDEDTKLNLSRFYKLFIILLIIIFIQKLLQIIDP